MNLAAHRPACRRLAAVVVGALLGLAVAGCGTGARSPSRPLPGASRTIDTTPPASDPTLPGAPARSNPAARGFAGAPAPAIKGTNAFTGEAFAWSELQGKPVFVNFFATWCYPCRQEMPAIERFYQGRGDRFYVIGVGADAHESAEQLAKFARDLGVTFPVIHDAGQAAPSYQLIGVPTSFFIDARGMVAVRHQGALDLAGLQRYMQTLSPARAP